MPGAALQPLQAAAASPLLQDPRLQAFYSDPRLQALTAGAGPPVLHLPEGYNGGPLPGAAGAGDGAGQGEGRKIIIIKKVVKKP